MIVLAEAHIDAAGTRHAHPVATGAEIICERCDEAKLAAGLADTDLARGACIRLRVIEVG